MREALRKKEILSAELWRNMLKFLAWISDFRIFKGSKVKVGRDKANYSRAAGGHRWGDSSLQKSSGLSDCLGQMLGFRRNS